MVVRSLQHIALTSNAWSVFESVDSFEIYNTRIGSQFALLA